MIARVVLFVFAGPFAYPFLGNIGEVSGHVYKIFTKWQQKYGEIYYCKFGQIP